MVGLKVTIDLKAVLARFQRMRDMQLILPEAKQSAALLEKIFKKYTPVSQDKSQQNPGKLQEGWEGHAQGGGFGTQVTLSVRNHDPRAPKAWPALLQGTRRHVINAAHAKALAFRFANGDMFFGQSVVHPGAKPKVDTHGLQKDVTLEFARLRQRIAMVLTQPQKGSL